MGKMGGVEVREIWAYLYKVVRENPCFSELYIITQGYPSARTGKISIICSTNIHFLVCYGAWKLWQQINFTDVTLESLLQQKRIYQFPAMNKSATLTKKSWRTIKNMRQNHLKNQSIVLHVPWNRKKSVFSFLKFKWMIRFFRTAKKILNLHPKTVDGNCFSSLMRKKIHRRSTQLIQKDSLPHSSKMVDRLRAGFKSFSDHTVEKFQALPVYIPISSIERRKKF